MNRRLLLVAPLLLAITVSAQNFTNARVQQVDARGGVAQMIGRGSGWYAWSVPLHEDVSICCGSCSLDNNRGWSINVDRDKNGLGGGGSMILAVKVEAGEVTKVQMFDDSCSINGRDNEVHVLQNVDPASSIAFLAAQDAHEVLGAIAQHAHPNAVAVLEQKAGRSNSQKTREDALFWLGNRGGERGFRFLRDFLRSNENTSLRKKAVFAVSQSDADEAVSELINLARRDESREIRREAIFWLGQRAGEKASAELRRAVDEDPDEDVREHAVFAISQLPRERSVPMLIDLVKNHSSAGVRKKAMFWLAQTGDQRAIDVIEEILMK